MLRPNLLSVGRWHRGGGEESRWRSRQLPVPSPHSKACLPPAPLTSKVLKVPLNVGVKLHDKNSVRLLFCLFRIGSIDSQSVLLIANLFYR